MTIADVLVLGEANPDLVLRGDVVPPFGQAEQLLDAADLVLGGSGAITAHALARLGLRVLLLAETGDDFFGRFVREELRAAGVVLAPTAPVGRPTGLTVVLSTGPDRSMLTLTGAIDAPPPSWREPRDVPAARHLHLASFYLQSRRAAALPRLLPLARAAGSTISLDTNLDPRGEFAGLDEVLPHVDVLLPNTAEVLSIVRAVAGLATTDPAEAARAVAAYGPIVVVKDGPRGALLAHGDDLLREPGRPVAAVDTTGAGDTFDAGFIAARLHGLDLRQALRWACAAGAAATRATGGTGSQPTRTELDAALREAP